MAPRLGRRRIGRFGWRPEYLLVRRCDALDLPMTDELSWSASRLTLRVYSRNDAFREMVKRRGYRLGKRAERAAATRRRIVEATITLHDEQGITGTSFRDVADRAGVSPATVLRHFPRMDRLIQACGELSDQLLPMPTEAVLVGARDRGEAVRLLARALFGWFDQIGRGLEHLQIDRRALPEVDAWLRSVDRQHRELVAAALGPTADASTLAIVTAMSSYGAWRSLRDAGMDAEQAAAEVARFVISTSASPMSLEPEPRRVH
jgi:AcrR family transcriptional regulator